MEWELAWLPTSRLKLNLNGRYSDIRQTSDDASLSAPLQLTPSADYLSPEIAAGRFRWYLDYSYTRNTGNGRFDEDPQLANTRLTWIMNSSAGEFSFWVRNLSDEKAITSYADKMQEVLDTTFITRAEPRTFGLDYRYFF